MISVEAERFKLAEVFTISRGSKTEAAVVTARVTRGGVAGQGEAVPYARYNESIESVIAQIEGLPADITRMDLQEALPSGAARNAVDCALWDLEAKTLGKRVWEMAGWPAPQPEVTCYTLSLDTPERMQAAAARHADRPILKIKLGTADDMARLEAVRRGAPQSKILGDANEGWDVATYLDLAPHLQRLGVVLVEQPLPAGADEGLRGIARPVPICADESCHDRASLEGMAGKYDFINIKLDKTGGLTEALLLRDAAVQQGFGIMVGCMVGSSLAMAPALIVAQGAGFVDLDGPLLLAQDRDAPLRYAEGMVYPPVAELWG
jgi:L-alanine-DL-glutamate epimerase-like enolase superfamily enzyme